MKGKIKAPGILLELKGGPGSGAARLNCAFVLEIRGERVGPAGPGGGTGSRGMDGNCVGRGWDVHPEPWVDVAEHRNGPESLGVTPGLWLLRVKCPVWLWGHPKALLGSCSVALNQRQQKGREEGKNQLENIPEQPRLFWDVGFIKRGRKTEARAEPPRPGAGGIFVSGSEFQLCLPRLRHL